MVSKIFDEDSKMLLWRFSSFLIKNTLSEKVLSNSIVCFKYSNWFVVSQTFVDMLFILSLRKVSLFIFNVSSPSPIGSISLW